MFGVPRNETREISGIFDDRDALRRQVLLDERVPIAPPDRNEAGGASQPNRADLPSCHSAADVYHRGNAKGV